MEIDITRAIGAVRRDLYTRECGDRTERVLVATRSFDTSADDLWDAITSPARIGSWLTSISGDLKLGGRYQLEGNASGTIERCEPPSELRVTWEGQGHMSWVEVKLTGVQDGTELRLEHIACVSEEMWDQFGPGAVGVGWELALARLDYNLTNRTTIDFDTKIQWLRRNEGKDFVDRISRAWCAASIRFGTGAMAAGEGAKRTTAFYTTGPE